MATAANKPELEISLLRTFLAVVHHGTLGRTATARRMTQPAVSQQMMRLEKIVNQRLFARSRNGVTLTAHGELLIIYANRAIELNDDTLARLRNENSHERVRVGLSADVALIGLASSLRSFRRCDPKVELKVVVAEPSKLDSMLKEGELDLVVANPADVVGTPILAWRVPLVWAASTDFRIDISQSLPIVLFEQPNSWRQGLLGSLGRAGRDWHIACESTSLDVILNALESGLGISPLPVQAIRKAGLGLVSNLDLPAPPPIGIGLFKSSGCPSAARSAMEAALIAGLNVRSGDATIVDAPIMNTAIINECVAVS
jgi:DNA-binding transcriptional LysR family regulator